MIDNQDKQTQPLDLGPAPKRRGRPAKQNALSNAERQRLYRERMKSKSTGEGLVDERRLEAAQKEIEAYKAATTELCDRIERQWAEIKELKEQLSQRNEKSENHTVPYDEVVAIAQELGERCKKAEERVKELERQLAQRNTNTKGDMPGVWIVEVKRRGTRTWKPCGSPESSLIDAQKSVNYMQFESGSGQGEEWRALRADGMIYWPLWAKAKAPK